MLYSLVWFPFKKKRVGRSVLLSAAARGAAVVLEPALLPLPPFLLFPFWLSGWFWVL